MKRGRGKAKRQSAVASHEDPGSGEEEKISASKQRGRPTKPSKDDIDHEEEEAGKIEEDNDMLKDVISKKDAKKQAAFENGRKRKRAGHAKENDSAKEENGIGPESTMDDLTKTAGFRHNASRRKNKPRRAAEVGVECLLSSISLF